MELRRMALFLQDDEETFAQLLADKTNADMIAEQKHLEAEIQKATQRHEDVLRLYEKIYEENAAGKVSDEWFMQLSHKYEVERMELKQKIQGWKQRQVELSTMKQNKDNFIAAVRKFMEMDRLTPALLHELIDHIEVHEAQGVGKNRTQHIVIYYRFVGYVEIPECSSHGRASPAGP